MASCSRNDDDIDRGYHQVKVSGKKIRNTMRWKRTLSISYAVVLPLPLSLL
jgi:hypothetical protein